MKKILQPLNLLLLFLVLPVACGNNGRELRGEKRAVKLENITPDLQFNVIENRPNNSVKVEICWRTIPEAEAYRLVIGAEEATVANLASGTNIMNFEGSCQKCERETLIGSKEYYLLIVKLKEHEVRSAIYEFCVSSINKEAKPVASIVESPAAEKPTQPLNLEEGKSAKTPNITEEDASKGEPAAKKEDDEAPSPTQTKKFIRSKSFNSLGGTKKSSPTSPLAATVSFEDEELSSDPSSDEGETKDPKDRRDDIGGFRTPVRGREPEQRVRERTRSRSAAHLPRPDFLRSEGDKATPKEAKIQRPKLGASASEPKKETHKKIVKTNSLMELKSRRKKLDDDSDSDG